MKTLIRGVRLRSFTSGRPHARSADMLVHGSAIETVAAAGSIAAAADITVINAQSPSEGPADQRASHFPG